MIGAIYGDVLGSIYESWIFQDAIVNKTDIRLFSSAALFTDDTVLTVAIADAIIENKPYTDKIIEWFNKYPNRGYGSSFVEWISEYKNNPKFRNNSYGNGAMMRVSPIAYAFDDLKTAEKNAIEQSEFTHNHEESYIGVKAIVSAVWLAKRNFSKDEIKKYIENTFGYDLNKTIQEVRDTFDHRTTRCSITCPQALIVFLQSESFEDTILNAIYSKGDCDTIAAIAGSIAYPYYKYNVPDNIKNFVFSKLPPDMLLVIDKFNKKFL
jgi:ADP-ribosylglycohydrolase